MQSTVSQRREEERREDGDEKALSTLVATAV
jgi:hypothetical protein